ncbi:MAG: 5'-nucleotidase C-terminal domain-containing protein, partial [Bacteroidota bacterium]
VMNAMGVDYVVFGNHEFDLKEADLLERIDESKFDWIASNVLHRIKGGLEPFTQSDKPLPKSRLLLAGDYKIGLIGVTLENNEPGYVDIAEVYAGAKLVYDSLAPYADIMVAITHLSIAEDRELARRLPGLKLIMGGHEHEAHYEKVGEVVIAKADANAKSAYIHTLRPKKRKGQVPAIRSELVQMDTTIALHPGVDSLVNAWEDRAYGQLRSQGFALDDVVTTLKEPLDGRESSIRQRPTNLGDAIAKAMFEATLNPDCAVFNSGSVRIDDQLQGTITQFDIIRTLPFGGDIRTVVLKGGLLDKVLKAGLANKGSGGFLQTYRISQSGESWIVAGTPLETDKTYRVAMPGFLISGREMGLEFLTADNPDVEEVIEPEASSPARDVRLALVEYLKKQ